MNLYHIVSYLYTTVYLIFFVQHSNEDYNVYMALNTWFAQRIAFH